MMRPAAPCVLACALSIALVAPPSAGAAAVIGTGSRAVLGHDLTDPQDNGVETPASTGTNLDATFATNDVAGFNHRFEDPCAEKTWDTMASGDASLQCED
jgi:hypothetical protein